MDDFIKELLRALADDKIIQVNDNVGRVNIEDWVDMKPRNALHSIYDYFNFVNLKERFRVKPATIRIGEYDVPAPMTAPPLKHEVYYFPELVPGFRSTRWVDDSYDRQRLVAGLCHSSGASATIHAEALMSLTAKKK